MRLNHQSPGGKFLLSQGVTTEILDVASFRVLNWQFGDALTVIWPFGRATIFMKSRFLERDQHGNLPVNRNLALIRHELHHVEQGLKWGFAGYWAKHFWARIHHRSMLARNSSVEAPAYRLQYAALDALNEPRPGA